MEVYEVCAELFDWTGGNVDADCLFDFGVGGCPKEVEEAFGCLQSIWEIVVVLVCGVERGDGGDAINEKIAWI